MVNIEVHEDGSIDISSQLSPTRILNLLSITRKWWTGLRIYSNNGTLLSLKPIVAMPSSTLWLRILAKTIYNPHREMGFTYESFGPYPLTALKADIQRCVKMDDDVLTQFMEADEIFATLDRAETFDKVLFVVKQILGLEDIA